MQTPKVYITTTLLNSHYYYMRSKPEYEQQKYAEFLDTLNKKPFEPNELIKSGLKFEADVRALSEGRGVGLNLDEITDSKLDELKTAAEIAKTVKGGLWQQTVEKWVKVGGVNVLLYGKLDVELPGVIFDIKRTNRYELGKYAASPQHDIYMLGRNVPKFIYLASDGKNVWPEEYHLTKETEPRLLGRIADFFGWLKNAGLWDVYASKWQAKY